MSRQKQILDILNENKDGIWVSEIAKKMKVAKSTVKYYIDGKIQNGKMYGGDLKDYIETVTVEGRNKIIRLKKENRRRPE